MDLPAMALPVWMPLWLYAVLMVWELFWKGIALWKSARSHQKVWFIAILVLNTIGLLPIIYLLFGQKGNAKTRAKPKRKKRRK